MADSARAGLSRREARRFGLVVGAAFLVLGTLVRARSGAAAGVALGAVGAALLVAAVVVPGALPPVHRAWMGAALMISRVTTPIVLAIVYFGVITPTGIVRRLFGGEPARPGRGGRGEGSAWVARDESARRVADMDRQF